MMNAMSVGYDEIRETPVKELSEDFGKIEVELKTVTVETR